MVRWLRWHCPSDTGFEIRALAVWGRARYLSVTEAPHSTDFHTWMGKKHICFIQTAKTGNRTPNSGVEGSGANHYPRAPAGGYRRVSYFQYYFYLNYFYGVFKKWTKLNLILEYIHSRYFYLIFRSVRQVVGDFHTSWRGSRPTDSGCESSDPWWWLASRGMNTIVWSRDTGYTSKAVCQLMKTN